MFKEIRPDNVIMFAMKHYSNPQGDTQTEFNEDMKRFKSVSYTHLTLPTNREV